MACCKKKDQVDCCMQDHLVCVCMGVMSSEICSAIDKGADTFEQLSQELLVGTGCSSCIPEVNDLLQAKQKKDE